MLKGHYEKEPPKAMYYWEMEKYGRKPDWK